MNPLCSIARGFAQWRTACLLLTLLVPAAVHSAPANVAVADADWQPLSAQVKRLLEALDYLGVPLDPKTLSVLNEAMQEKNIKGAGERIQNALDPHCLFVISINPEMRVKVAAGPAKPELVEQGWR